MSNGSTPSKRNTIQRELVLQAVRQLCDHPTPESVYQHIHTTHPRVSRGTVYRNLGVLVADGAIRRVPVPNGADRMDFAVRPHYHLQCLSCGGVFDLDVPYMQQYAEMFEDKQGSLVTGHQLIFSGYCRECRNKAVKPQTGE